MSSPRAMAASSSMCARSLAPSRTRTAAVAPMLASECVVSPSLGGRPPRPPRAGRAERRWGGASATRRRRGERWGGAEGREGARHGARAWAAMGRNPQATEKPR